ncbi:heavy-metal-associated domain-containing protein [Roseivivax sediminis]|uniref:Copper chaperone n=1 Tax=Roseivivax sediminis TaxID=936889 RepID=A0A1I1X8R5_9RHOB|nr:heavy-metal-associated domain-containing protein [Roseivivax sediminis]SFE03742.1 copper chaperone [Roseivivax sediminis]
MKFSVPDMSCGHCTAAIEKELKAKAPGATVSCDLGSRIVEVMGAEPDQVQAAIRDAGYDARPAA